MTPTPPPTPLRRPGWVAEVRCTNWPCRWHIVTLRIVSGAAVIEAEKRRCPGCGKYTVQVVEMQEAVA